MSREPSGGLQTTIQQPTTLTYSIQDANKLPTQVLADLADNSQVPVVLPQSLPTFSSPPSPGDGLAVNAAVSASGYDLTFFWRPNKSHTSNYNVEQLIGYIAASSQPRVQPFIPDSSQVQREKWLRLAGGTAAVEYPNLQFGDRRIITWKNQKWTYLTYGLSSPSTPYDLTSLGMANSIAQNLSSHGPLLSNVKQGFVQATVLSNRPFVVITWTYNNKVWYAVSLRDIGDSLDTARSARLLRG